MFGAYLAPLSVVLWVVAILMRLAGGDRAKERTVRLSAALGLLGVAVVAGFAGARTGISGLPLILASSAASFIPVATFTHLSSRVAWALAATGVAWIGISSVVWPGNEVGVVLTIAAAVLSGLTQVVFAYVGLARGVFGD